MLDQSSTGTKSRPLQGKRASASSCQNAFPGSQANILWTLIFEVALLLIRTDP